VTLTTLALAAALAAMQVPSYDTVVLTNGGVLRGTVVEDVPGTDVVLQMPDGTLRRLPRAEVMRVDYAQPPGPPPESAPPPVPLPISTVFPWQFALDVFAAIPFGTLAGGIPITSISTPQFAVTLEAAWRPAVPLALGLYLRLSGGGAQPPINSWCLAAGGSCDSFGLGVGLFPRWSFIPQGEVNPWVSVNGGYELLSVVNDYQAAVDYSGWEVGASAGVDWRRDPWYGLGVFVGVGLGSYTSVSVTGAPPPAQGIPAIPWGNAALHGWVNAGLRVVLWP